MSGVYPENFSLISNKFLLQFEDFHKSIIFQTSDNVGISGLYNFFLTEWALL